MKRYYRSIALAAILATMMVPVLFSQTLIFRSGFESGKNADGTPNSNPTRIVPGKYAQQPYIVGNEGFGAIKSDWVEDLQKGDTTKMNFFQLNYEGGTDAQRIAEIVTDPVNSSNKVMHFQINEPNVVLKDASGNVTQIKARVQAEIRNLKKAPSNVKKYYQRIKIFFPKDFEALIASDRPRGADWLSLFEYHDKVPSTITSINCDFRTTLRFEKSTGTNNKNLPLYFKVSADENSSSGYAYKWGGINTDYIVPLGKWIDTELYIQEGRDTDGRFYFAVKADGETNWTVIFDKHVQTVHSKNTFLTGMTDWSPMKFYSSDLLAKVFTGGPKMHIYWDDLEIWVDRDLTYQAPATAINVKEAATDIALKAFPNPFKDVLNLNFVASLGQWVACIVSDLQGRVFIETQYVAASNGDNTVQMDVKSLAAGTYIVKIAPNGKPVKSAVIVKQ